MPNTKQIRIHKALIMAGLVGVVAIFFPIFKDMSPLDAVRGFEGELLISAGLPYFLALPITAALVRLSRSGALSSTETVLAFVMSAGAILFYLPTYNYLLTMGLIPGSSWAEVTALGYLKSIFPALIYGLTLIAGISYFVVGLGKGSFGEYAPVVAMQIAYIVHSVGFPFLFDKWHAGTYLTLLAAVAYVVQIVSNHLGRRSVGE